jgi:hypothetical protein
MASSDIRIALEGIPAGTRVRLKLRDDKEMSATRRELDSMVEEGDVHLDQVESVLVDAASGDPE